MLRALVLLLVLFFPGTGFAANLSPIDSESIAELLSSTGQETATILIEGYVTERANPIVDYNRSYVREGNSLLQIFPKLDLAKVVKIFEDAGISKRVISGGTSYIQYEAKIECESKEKCFVNPSSL